jgi:hypothetical protein
VGLQQPFTIPYRAVLAAAAAIMGTCLAVYHTDEAADDRYQRAHLDADEPSEPLIDLLETPVHIVAEAMELAAKLTHLATKLTSLLARLATELIHLAAKLTHLAAELVPKLAHLAAELVPKLAHLAAKLAPKLAHVAAKVTDHRTNVAEHGRVMVHPFFQRSNPILETSHRPSGDQAIRGPIVHRHRCTRRAERKGPASQNTWSPRSRFYSGPSARIAQKMRPTRSRLPSSARTR